MAQQPFYHTDDEVGFDSQTKRDAVSIPHTIPSDSQQELLDRNLGCLNTGAELEVKGRGPTRRRIQVACVRCRKRKIKCSGDVGDGLGCSNCRSAGNTPCQFLRVNSSIFSIVPPKAHSAGSGWPYPPSDIVSQRSGIYAPSVACKLELLSAKTLSHRGSPFLRIPDHEVASDSPNPYGRQPYAIDSTTNYEDESATPYNIPPSSAYMLPSSPQVLMTDYCASGWGSRNWGPSLQGGRAPGDTMLSEAESDNTLNPAYSYVMPGQAGQANEALSMMATPVSLTSPTQGTERTLPNPASRHTLPGNNNGPTTTAEDIPTRDYRLCWRTKATSNVSLGTATGKRVRLVPSCAQDTSFGLLPGESSNGSSPSTQSSGAFASSEAAGSVADPGDEYRGAMDSRLRGCSPRHNKRAMSPFHSKADYYSHTMPAYRTRLAGDTSSESTLITGLPYERPKHPMPIPTLTSDEFSDYKIAPGHFSTPVPALGHSSGF
ncbi:hypothetical protein BJX68DRAFT_171636 [Aspergillus pseudodeflectus]|uniref:Zn(2)-C6 fungal-type domain-containing protein n=1 Tax=Aspergillus pseudodeflectus TaxID=176178 RepID=A0ABR4JN67_9EURO